MRLAFTDRSHNTIPQEAKILAGYQHFIAVKTNAYLPWLTTICVTSQIGFMFTDYYIRQDPDRIYARILPTVLGIVVFWLWLRKIPPEQLLRIRRVWDVSVFIDAYWLCLLSYRTPAFVSTLGSIPFAVFSITFLSSYSTKYLVLLYSVSMSLFVGIIIVQHGIQNDLIELNAIVITMLVCLVLNHWRAKLYFSEFSLKWQLEAAIQSLTATQAQLVQKEKMAALGELTAGIAHEIQNPLNFVNNFADLSAEMLDELVDEQRKAQRDLDLEADLIGDLKDNLVKIIHHGQRAANTVRSMLEHSRTSSGEVQSTDLNALADEYLRLAYHGYRAKDKAFNCELITHFDASLGEVDLMALEVGRVLLNLFNNAFYAVSERQKLADSDYQPTVTVSTLNTKQGLQLTVHDNGVGIPSSVEQKIFQPFFTTKPTGEGTGLGLSLAYDIITKGHNGSLTVASWEGQGTEFTLSLPTKPTLV